MTESTKKHSVKAIIQIEALSKAGTAINFEIYSDGTKLGTIEIGQGTFGWRGANRKSIKRKSWTAFESFMSSKW